MKSTLMTLTLVVLGLTTVKAQKQAQMDNGQFVAVAQTQTTVGKNTQTHYKFTNNNTVSMDFSLYKEMKNGSWDVTKHLDLRAGQTYEDVTGFGGYTGKYVVYSAPHSDYASFPNAADIAGLQAAAGVAPAVPATPPATTPTTPPATPATTPKP